MTASAGAHVLLVDPAESSSGVLAGRLRMQGYVVTDAVAAVEGARLALSDPPRAVIADLWMPSISGVQLCRLLKAEPGTSSVPVILRGPDGQRNRFWAERAGAAAYVVKGRMGDLVRALGRAIEEAPPNDGFFTHLAGDDTDVRDRIAWHLDQALFESVIASEIRALGTCGAFDRLFDLFSQFVCQVTSYRWLAVSIDKPVRLGIHANPATRVDCEEEAKVALELPQTVPVIRVEDDDAFDEPTGPVPLVYPIQLGDELIGRMALALREPAGLQDRSLVSVMARELAGPMRMATLVEESQLLSRIDPLTGLHNRRSFREHLAVEVARARRHQTPLTCILFDLDHFKLVNDHHGHATGDAVLSAVGGLLRAQGRQTDVCCRWGGEEFVVALHQCDLEGAALVAERLRAAVVLLVVHSPSGEKLSLSASFGVALLETEDDCDSLIDRADCAMYEAKTTGRNRVVVASPSAQRQQTA